MAWDLSHEASISVLVLLSVSVLLTRCLIVMTTCCSRKASGKNFELQERGEGQAGHAKHQSHGVDDAREILGSRIEHRGQEDHPDLEDSPNLEGHSDLQEHPDLQKKHPDLQKHPDLENHEDQDGHQSRANYRGDDNILLSERSSLRTIHER